MTEDATTARTEEARRAFGFRECCIVVLAFFPPLVAFSLLPLQPPAVVEADAPATEFSAMRAKEHLEVIATAPHPIGTPAHTEVRNYIVRQIEALGLEPQIQHEVVIGRSYGQLQASKINNVLTRIPGQNSNAALLVMAHYDSVPHSPGASDDGAGVAALLETLRALRKGPALSNDVIFLFTDAEEDGLVGAKAFHKYHPWQSDVSLVLNLEARGASGPSIMFETGDGNGELMELFASFASQPVASSYSYDVYRYLPNDTDYSVFKRAGLAGFNFAFIDDIAAYHSRLDSIDRLDLRSLQHHGDYALELSRGFGNIDPETIGSGANSIYFNVPLLGLVVYSTRWALPLVAVLALMTAILLYLGMSKKRVSLGRAMLSLIACPIAIVLTALAVGLVHRGLFNMLVTGRGMVGSPALYRLGLVLIALAMIVALLSAVGKKLGVVNLGAGASLWWLLMAAAAVLYLPSTSYLLCWPLLFALVSLFLLLQEPKPEAPTLRTGALLLLLTTPAVLLWAPAIVLIGAAFGADAAVLLALIAALLASSISPQVKLLTPEHRGWALPTTILLIGLGLTLTIAAGAGYDAERPRANGVFYALDTEAQTAIWATRDQQVDDWTSQFLSGDVQPRTLSGFFSSDRKILAVDAPMLPLPAPVTTRVAPEEAHTDPADGIPASDSTMEPTASEGIAASDEESVDAGKRFRLHVVSPRQAGELSLALRSEAELTHLAIEGREVNLELLRRSGDAPPYSWRMGLFGIAAEGWHVEVEFDRAAPLTVTTHDRVYGLPEVPGFSYEPRPEHLRPSSYLPTDLSLVRSVVDF